MTKIAALIVFLLSFTFATLAPVYAASHEKATATEKAPAEGDKKEAAEGEKKKEADEGDEEPECD